MRAANPFETTHFSVGLAGTVFRRIPASPSAPKQNDPPNKTLENFAVAVLQFRLIMGHDTSLMTANLLPQTPRLVAAHEDQANSYFAPSRKVYAPNLRRVPLVQI